MTTDDPHAALLRDQAKYYEAHAPVYSEWIVDYMAPVQQQITEELARLITPPGDVLEIAAGTGYFTAILSTLVSHVTALDISGAMLSILASRKLPNATTVQGDVFTWRPVADHSFQSIFMGHWLAHIPVATLPFFFKLIQQVLTPGGEVVIVDVTDDERFIEQGFRTDPETLDTLVPRTASGKSYWVVKNYWKPWRLLDLLETLGWGGISKPVGREIGRGFVIYRLWRNAE
jgi:ubiquinone/menaquinone biosynthesis C-methylase UbiE